MNAKEASDLINELHEACKKDDGLITETACLQTSMVFLLSGRDTPETSAEYIRKRIAQINQDHEATQLKTK